MDSFFAGPPRVPAPLRLAGVVALLAALAFLGRAAGFGSAPDGREEVRRAGIPGLDPPPAAPPDETPGELERALATPDTPAPARPDEEPARAPTPRRAPRIAIVFDDLGWSRTGLAAELLEIDAPLTFAVIPGLDHSSTFARDARARGHEVILHLPMEPLDLARHDPGEHALFPRLDRAENLRRLRRHLDALDGWTGVSNHMGSRATADAALVDLVLGELSRREGSPFFLDSRTTPHSLVPDRARRAGVRCLVNNMFLDGGDEGAPPPSVQARRVDAIARRNGSAVVIGHVRRPTVDAVRTSLARWRAEGFELVRLSDLMHR